MKSIIYSLLIGCVVLSTCKKNNTAGTKPTDKTPHKVLFNVGFSAQTAKFNTNAITHLKTSSLALNDVDTALTNHISTLIYTIYNSNGTFVNQVTQLATDAGFGSYTDILLPGNYTVCIAGGGPGLAVFSDSSSTHLAAAVLGYGNGIALYKYDTFFQKINLAVTGTDQTQSIALNRITNLVKVVIRDAIPANVKTLNFYISGAGSNYFMGSEKVYGIGGSSGMYTLRDTIQASDIGKTNFTVSQMLLYPSPLTVKIDASSTLNPLTGGDIAEKNITNVTCLPNSQTILSGDLFGGSGTNGGNGFTVGIDTAYSNTPIVKTFP